MRGLAEWQAALSGVIDAESSDPATLICLRDVPGPSARQGCSVYRNNSRGARGKALLDVYPVCRRLLGERSFAGLGRRFVECVPSQQGDLNRFGAGFADFVAETVASHEGFAALPWLGDLVRLEWHCHSVYYAADDAPIDLSPLQCGDPSSFRPRPVSRVAWLHSAWPVHRIWQAHQGADEPAEMQIDRGDWHLLVERDGFQARVENIDAALWKLLDACGRGLTLGELGADRDLDIGRLGTLVRRHWLGALEHGDPLVCPAP